MGVPGLADHVSSCPLCFSSGADLYKFAALSPLGAPFPEKTLAHFDRACRGCEVASQVRSADERSRLKATLACDKTRGGSARRALQADLPELGLRRKDRLEPSQSHLDVVMFGDINLPSTVVLWRRPEGTAAHHRNPLFSPAIGVEPLHLGLDWLHTRSLGVVAVTLTQVPGS